MQGNGAPLGGQDVARKRALSGPTGVSRNVNPVRQPQNTSTASASSSSTRKRLTWEQLVPDDIAKLQNIVGVFKNVSTDAELDASFMPAVLFPGDDPA